MSELFIKHKGKRYKVNEPTIKTWAEIMKHKDLMDETEMFVKTIELTTPLTREEILQADANEIYIAGEAILTSLYGSQRNLQMTIEHKGKEYQFMNIHDLSFGQFIDIDTFLSKNETYKIGNLNELAAYLYIEKGTKYGDNPVGPRKEAFVDLPMRYVEGAIFFLESLAKTSGLLTRIYSQSRLMRTTARIKIISVLIGDGIAQSVHSVRTRFGYLTSLLLYPLLSVSIISLTFWTLIRNRKGNKKNKIDE